jgi:hypothetical protein
MPRGFGLYTKQRGRSQSKVHLGAFVKHYLSDHIEASIPEIHSAYKEALKVAYPEQAKKHILHLPHYQSFYRFCNKLRRIGMIKEIKREKALVVGGVLNMTIDGHDPKTAVLTDAYKVVYVLTAAGMAAQDNNEWMKPDDYTVTGETDKDTSDT